MDVHSLLKESVEKGASDLHLMPGLSPQARIDGDLKSLNGHETLSPELARELAMQIMTEDQKKEFQENLHAEFSVLIQDIGIFRASIYNQNNGVTSVFRAIPEEVPSFESLLLPAQFKRMLGLPSGLIIICGPTGSGKSTTMAGMIDFINTNRACNIITIEDPIEYIHKNKKSAINQLQVGRDTHSFHGALKAALRQDPDVIMVGEMRDLETIRLVQAAADTGHLVITTLHARSAPHAINRIIDSFPDEEKNRVRNTLAEIVECVVFQSLVKKIGGGRIAAFEILISTPGIRHLIHRDMGPQMETAIQTGSEHGMCTIDQYIDQLVAKKHVAKATAEHYKSKKKVSSDPNK